MRTQGAPQRQRHDRPVQSAGPPSAADSRPCSRAASGLSRSNPGDLDCGPQARKTLRNTDPCGHRLNAWSRSPSPSGHAATNAPAQATIGPRGQKITRNEEEVSFGIRKKIQRKPREFQTAGGSWVSERCWSPAQARCLLRDLGHAQAADVRAHPCKERGVVGPARDVAAAARYQMRLQPPLEVRRLQRSGSGAKAGAPVGPGLPGWASFFVSSALAIGFIGFRDYRSVSEEIDGNIDILKYGIKLLMNISGQQYLRYTSVRLTFDRGPLFVQRMILPRIVETILNRFSGKTALRAQNGKRSPRKSMYQTYGFTGTETYPSGAFNR